MTHQLRAYTAAEPDLRTTEWERLETAGGPPEGVETHAPEWPDGPSMRERLRDMERAAGKDGPGERGIAGRLDELEDRIEALEN